MGPNAAAAIPALQIALAKAEVKESNLLRICTGPCMSLADEYKHAMACIQLSREQFYIDYRFDRSCQPRLKHP
jgi:hypothetical protein